MRISDPELAATGESAAGVLEVTAGVVTLGLAFDVDVVLEQPPIKARIKIIVMKQIKTVLGVECFSIGSSIPEFGLAGSFKFIH